MNQYILTFIITTVIFGLGLFVKSFVNFYIYAKIRESLIITASIYMKKHLNNEIDFKTLKEKMLKNVEQINMSWWLEKLELINDQPNKLIVFFRLKLFSKSDYEFSINIDEMKKIFNK